MPYSFSVVIPTFNRAHLLLRALRSIEAQTCRDFEVVIVDDGSTDNTFDLISEWREAVDFPVRYLRQPNQGKHVALNTAVCHAKGFFITVLDSDDELTPESLDRLLYHWHRIPEAERDGFVGVEALSYDMARDKVSGKPFPEDVMDADYLEMEKVHRVGGEKRGMKRVDVLLRFPFPVFPGERYLRPSLVWKRIAREYRTLYVNEVVQRNEYQRGGLTSDRFRLRMGNPRGFQLYFQDEITLHAARNTRWALINAYAKFVRYSLHAGMGFRQQAKIAPRKSLWLIGLISGTVGWMRDHIKAFYRRRYADDARP